MQEKHTMLEDKHTHTIYGYTGHTGMNIQSNTQSNTQARNIERFHQFFV